MCILLGPAGNLTVRLGLQERKNAVIAVGSVSKACEAETRTVCGDPSFPRNLGMEPAPARLALERGDEAAAAAEGRGEQRPPSSQPASRRRAGPEGKCACAARRGRGRGLGRSVRLRTARGEVGEGGPCVSVLLFRGGGGGGKMAAHGGSAASSALKGLIQQFTAITETRLPEGGEWGPERAAGLPRAPPYLHAFRLRALPAAAVLPPEEEATTALGGLRVQAGDSPPRPRHRRSRSPDSVEGDPQPPPVQTWEWTESVRPRRPGDPGAGGVGGRTRATALLLPFIILPSLCSPGVRRISSPPFLFFPVKSFCPGPRPALPFSGPLGAIAMALAGSGPPAFTARLVGSAVPVPFPGDRPPEAGGAGEDLRD
ncbi:LOW QUALITY PROTEIN: hypothetical protein AAY473_037808 [Plecturocebus cupreus]